MPKVVVGHTSGGDWEDIYREDWILTVLTKLMEIIIALIFCGPGSFFILYYFTHISFS
jgi:hypothetical protein